MSYAWGFVDSHVPGNTGFIFQYTNRITSTLSKLDPLFIYNNIYGELHKNVITFKGNSYQRQYNIDILFAPFLNSFLSWIDFVYGEINSYTLHV